MAEPLYALGEGLHWTPAAAPRGQFVAIHDCVEAGGAFLVHHFVALFLKAGHRVCFITTTHSVEHYCAVGRKLGVNLNASIEKQTLRVIDCFSDASTGSLSSSSLFAKIRDEVSAAARASLPLSIVVDDLSTFKWQWGREQLIQFLRCCRALAPASQGNVNTVVLSHADADGSSESSALVCTLTPALAELATVVITVAPLPSGYFKDVHGTITVERQCGGLEAIYDKSVMSFKVLENTIKSFASGGDALRSL